MCIYVRGCLSPQFLEASVEAGEPSPPPQEETDDADDLVRLALFVLGRAHTIDSLYHTPSFVAAGYDVKHNVTILYPFSAKLLPYTPRSVTMVFLNKR